MKKYLANLFKKNKNIEFYSILLGPSDLYPVTTSSKFVPKWFKTKLKEFNKRRIHDSDSVGTNLERVFDISKCPGIREYFKTGYIVYLHTDIKIFTKNSIITNVQWLYNTSDSNYSNKFVSTSLIEIHSPDQLGDYMSPTPPKNSLKQLLKINTPWKVKCPDDYVLLEIPILYSDDNRFCAAGGILDPKISRNINPAFWWFVHDGEEVIPAGTPLLQYIPIKRDNNLNLIIRDACEADLKYDSKYDYLTKHVACPHFNNYKTLTKKINC